MSVYCPSPYVVPLTHEPPTDHVIELCWCARERVHVHLVAAAKGITRSCGHPDCGPPNVCSERVGLGHNICGPSAASTAPARDHQPMEG